MKEAISIDEALSLVMERRINMNACNVSLLQALGRVLAQDQSVRFDMPPHDLAAMDGYAFRFRDNSSGRLKAGGFLPAGAAPLSGIPEDRAVRIMTGAPMPQGFDTVVPLEHLEVDRDGIVFLQPFSKGDNVRCRGEEARAGDTLVRGGTLLRPQEIAMLAAMNIPELPVSERPRASILSTGDELLEPGSELLPGRIINSNSSAVAALCLDAGADPLLRGVARDTLAETAGKLEACLDADLVLVSGGASAGDRDHVCNAVRELDGEIIFSGVRIKPGRPFGLAMIGKTPVFIMPGYPVAAMVIFELFIRPLLLAATGLKKIFRPRVSAVITEKCRNSGRRPHFAGARLELSDGAFHAAITGSQSSGRIASLSHANSLLCLAPETDYQPGDRVMALLIDGNAGMASECQWG